MDRWARLEMYVLNLQLEHYGSMNGWMDRKTTKNNDDDEWTGGWLERNKKVEVPVRFICEDCGKECRSKGVLTIHRKRMHKVSKLEQTFSCKKCGKPFQQEANLLNHRKFAQECSGEIVRAKKYVAKRKECPHCGKKMAATNISRHI